MIWRDNPLIDETKDLESALQEYISKGVEGDRVLTIDPITDTVFSGNPAVEAEITFDATKNKSGGYIQQDRVLLTQYGAEKILIISYWRFGSETIRKDLFNEMQQIVNSIQFDPPP